MNPRLQAVAPSLIRAINARKRPGDIDLGLGEPTLRPNAVWFEAALDWVRRHGCPYTANAGFTELREAVGSYLGLPPAGAERVVVTVGSEEALFLAIKTTIDPARDQVLVVEPAYGAYEKICRMEGIRVQAVPLAPETGFAPSAERVLAALTPAIRLVVLNSPNNPTGRVWPAAELAALTAGLQQRSGPPAYLLLDEVYRELRYTAEEPPSLLARYPHALVAGSISKSNALTGLRLGWLAGPASVIAEAVKVHQFVNTAADTFAQRVALELLRDPAALAVHRPHYTAARRNLLNALQRYGLDHVPPEGAFYCMLRLPLPLASDSVAAANRLLEQTRVVTVPGRAFGAAAEGWLRISWVADQEAVEEGVRRIAAWFAAA